jgi:hypothetical protein
VYDTVAFVLRRNWVAKEHSNGEVNFLSLRRADRALLGRDDYELCLILSRYFDSDVLSPVSRLLARLS